MKLKITFEIECGTNSCAAAKGKFCRFLSWTMNGKNNCYLFGRVYDKDGWVQRHPDCRRKAKPWK